MFIGSANRITRTENQASALALDLNLRSAALDGRLTFARASAATDIINGLVTTFATDAPRISTANGLLMEEARTNMISYSQTLNGGSWSSGFTNSSRVNVSDTDPMGNVNSGLGRLTENTSSGEHRWAPYLAGVAVASAAYTFSVFFKSAGRSQISIGIYNGGSTSILKTSKFNISTGTITDDGGNSPTITALANGWYRCSMTATLGSSPASAIECLIYLLNDSGATSYTGDGTSGVIAWGAQLEIGAFISSYIPTTTSSATRAVENCSMAVGGWFKENEGSFYAEGMTGHGYDSAATANTRLLRLDNNSNSMVHELRRNNTDNNSRVSTVCGGNTQSSIAMGLWASNLLVRMSYAYRHNDMAASYNGGTVLTDTTSPDGMPTGLSVLRVGSAGSSGNFGGYVRAIRYWNTRLTNDQLRGLTS